MLVVHARLPIAQDKMDQALELANRLVEESRAEDGIVAYFAAVDVENDHLLRFVEQYEDQAAFDAHVNSEHIKEFSAKVPELLAGKPEGTMFTIESSSPVEL